MNDIKESLPEKKKRKSIELIVSNSKHLFEKQGYYNTTIESLCKEAMISRTTFFNYFGTKEQIIVYVIEEDIRDFDKYVTDLIEDKKDDPVGVVRDTFDYLIKGSTNYINITSVLYQLSFQSPQFKKLLRDYVVIEKRAIEYAQSIHKLRSDFSSEFISKMIHGFYIDTLSRSERTDFVEEFNEGMDSIMELLIVNE